ncbi:Epidermal growth factor-like domain and CUB domain-containing protein [Strongyloides ratti]|uniref:Epidermal growth factor-like domain and CUB domain-containing protein n=1 Tax=Strongyloides ratti TaxID=34506 RepID=A0A090L6W2_STRRB|nr:Epidermal growth factor-like domain and CUB domain-containing protein [Strongyloides ratti]CEF63199.1 Epidermal growth factor-like domain and CUB domain-containing protein [Strongyloides ratti]
MIKIYFLYIFIIINFFNFFYAFDTTKTGTSTSVTQETTTKNLFSTPLIPSKIIQNAYDLAIKIESLSNDITNYLSKLNNKTEGSCSDGLIKNVQQLYGNVNNILSDVNEKQRNILLMEKDIENIKNIAACMKNSNCIPSQTTSIPTILSTLKPINNETCDQLNNNGIISNGKEYENINCQWNINVTESKYILLTINFLYLQGNTSLIITDKLYGNQTIYNKSIYQEITLSSYSNNYEISLVSNDSYSGASFKITYITNDVCYQNYCQNNGTCIVRPDNTPLCQCKGCFDGDTCTEALDRCKTYTKCLQDKNPRNTCSNESNNDDCIAKCYCNGSSTPTAFCRN